MLKLNSKITPTIQICSKYCSFTINRKWCSSKLVEIGKFETPKIDRYQIGQLFIHKVFGYRGLIALHWTGEVFDRDLHEHSGDNYEMVYIGGREVKCYTKNYYKVFIDSRDRPYVRTVHEASTAWAVTSNNCGRMLHCSPGLDYVAHEDILPYKATEPIPIKHEMLGDFFVYRSGNNISFEPKENLKTFQIKNSALMKIDVHKETTENVRVIAIPFYLGSQKVKNAMLYSWKYLIRLENLSGSLIRMLSQNWKIFDLKGGVEEACGDGVMGEEVVMFSSQPAFQYSSHINLLTPYGHMFGTFKMEKEDYSKFYCRIPHIMLESRRGLEEVVL